MTRFTTSRHKWKASKGPPARGSVILCVTGAPRPAWWLVEVLDPVSKDDREHAPGDFGVRYICSSFGHSDDETSTWVRDFEYTYIIPPERAAPLLMATALLGEPPEDMMIELTLREEDNHD